jgi:dihydrofolate reductase
MNRLILSTTMTVDAVISVADWYVSEGEHDRAAREQFEQPAAMLLGRKTYEGLAGSRSIPPSGEPATGRSRATRKSDSSSSGRRRSTRASRCSGTCLRPPPGRD